MQTENYLQTRHTGPGMDSSPRRLRAEPTWSAPYPVHPGRPRSIVSPTGISLWWAGTDANFSEQVGRVLGHTRVDAQYDWYILAASRLAFNCAAVFWWLCHRVCLPHEHRSCDGLRGGVFHRCRGRGGGVTTAAAGRQAQAAHKGGQADGMEGQTGRLAGVHGDPFTVQSGTFRLD
jgi:hypothetical protein